MRTKSTNLYCPKANKLAILTDDLIDAREAVARAQRIIAAEQDRGDESFSSFLSNHLLQAQLRVSDIEQQIAAL